MAFGKQTIYKRIEDPVRETYLFRSNIEREENSKRNWLTKWSWMMDEYKSLSEKMKSFQKGIRVDAATPDNECDDKKRIPIMNTTNHEYGWLVTRNGYKLEKYGPDYDRGPSLPKQYFLIK